VLYVFPSLPSLRLRNPGCDYFPVFDSLGADRIASSEPPKRTVGRSASPLVGRGGQGIPLSWVCWEVIIVGDQGLICESAL